MSDPIASIPLNLLRQHGDIVGFEYTDAFGHPTDGLIINHRDTLLAYRNECPHWNIPMDVDEVYDADADLLRCPYHGACFEAKDGLCSAGPVEGMYLQTLQVEVDAQASLAHIYLRAKLSLGF